jgi:hypothetical protein
MNKEYKVKHSVLKDGTEKWTRYNPSTGKHQYHRLDGPALIKPNGEKTWYKDGNYHREGGPAVIKLRTGTKQFNKYYYVEGVLHREDGPASIHGDGKEWYRDGLLHRLDGPALKHDKREEWYKDGQLHRTDGPAIIEDGKYCWYYEDELHREDGPAVYRVDTELTTELINKSINDLDKAISSNFGFKKMAQAIDKLLDYNKSVGKVTDVMWEMDDDVKWFKHGLLHREDGPAVISEGGNTQWYKDGKLHRLDGPAKVHPRNPHKDRWYKDGLLHRDGGPAKADKEVEEWYKDGKLHRTDGPARVRLYGDKRCEWFFEGKLHRLDGPAIYDKDHPEDSDMSLGKIAEEFKDLLIKVRDANNATDRGKSVSAVMDAWDNFADTVDTDKFYEDSDEGDKAFGVHFGYFHHGKRVTEAEATIASVGLADLLQ